MLIELLIRAGFLLFTSAGWLAAGARLIRWWEGVDRG